MPGEIIKLLRLLAYCLAWLFALEGRGSVWIAEKLRKWADNGLPLFGSRN